MRSPARQGSALVLAIAVMLAASCSPSDTTTATADRASEAQAVAQSGSTDDLSALFDGGLPTADDLVEAAQRLAATPQRFEFLLLPDAPDAPATDGSFDGTWSQADTRAPIETADAFAMSSITDGTTAFVTMPSLPEFGGPIDQNPMLAARDGWVKITIPDVLSNASPDARFNSGVSAIDIHADLQAILEQAANINEGPESTVRGAPVRNFTFSVVEENEILGTTETTVRLGIDARGWLRSFDTVSNGTTMQRIEFYDIGEPIVITQPDDARDITQDLRASLQAPPVFPPQQAAPTPAATVGADYTFFQIERQQDLNMFRALLEQSDIRTFLSQMSAERPITIFTPTNAALNTLGEDFTSMMADPDLATAYVARHVVMRPVDEAELAAVSEIVTMSDTLPVRTDGTRTFVADSQVLFHGADATSGGIIILAHALEP